MNKKTKKAVVEYWAEGELRKFGFGKDNPKIQYLIMLLTNEFHGKEFVNRSLLMEVKE